MSLNKQKQYSSDDVSTIHRADWVLVDPENLIKNGFVKTESGKIVDVGQGRGHGKSDQIIDHGAGVLMPGLVNAHTHLELSALKSKTDAASGFISWVKSVIEKREQTSEADLRQGVIQGLIYLQHTLIGQVNQKLWYEQHVRQQKPFYLHRFFCIQKNHSWHPLNIP